MGTHDPIAYTYEADTHCPACAEQRFGRSARGFIAEDATDLRYKLEKLEIRYRDTSNEFRTARQQLASLVKRVLLRR